MSVVYDTGVLVAADRNDRRVWAEHHARLELSVVPVTTAPVVAQASRSAGQVQLRRLLRGCEVVAFAPRQSHDVGMLLARAEMNDVVDAHVVITAALLDSAVVTSDPRDLRRLAGHLPSTVRVQQL